MHLVIVRRAAILFLASFCGAAPPQARSRWRCRRRRARAGRALTDSAWARRNWNNSEAANPFTRQLNTLATATTPTEATTANARPTQRRRMTTPTPTPPSPAATLRPLTATPTVGDTLVVPRDLWPTYPCHELGGAGWAVTVVRCHNTAARVRFSATHRTRDGRSYEDELITFQQLRTAG